MIVGAALVVFVYVAVRLREPTAPPRAPLPQALRPTVITASTAGQPITTLQPPPVRGQRAADTVTSVEVCGLGRMPLDADGVIVAPELEAQTAADMARWQDRLTNSSNVRARAVGLYLDSKSGADSLGINGNSLDSLVQLAQQARDSAVYFIALQACNVGQAITPGGACDQISLQAWAKLDPDNAAPWLYLVNAARISGDAAGETAAFANASKSAKIDAYNWSLLAFAEADMPGDITPLERWQMSGEIMSVEAGMYAPQNSAASKHCSTDFVVDADVRNACSQVAQLLVTKGTTLLDFAIGTAIGRRAAWRNRCRARVFEFIQRHSSRSGEQVP